MGRFSFRHVGFYMLASVRISQELDNLIRMRTVVLGERRSRRVSVKTGFILVLILYTFSFRD